MKRTRTAISLTLLTTLSGTLVAPVTSNAEWVQNPIGVPRAPGCDPGYSWQKIGVRYQCVTPQPSCAYGFASGPAWTGTAWNYSCNAPPPPPPPPTCPAGSTETSAPVWNGAAWVGQVCQPQATKPDPSASCQARANQDGITLGPLAKTQARTGYTYYYYYPSVGPSYIYPDGYTVSNQWEVICAITPTGTWASIGGAGPYAATQMIPSSAGGGG